MATQGLKQGCLLWPLLYALFTNYLGKFLNISWGNDSLANNQSFPL